MCSLASECGSGLLFELVAGRNFCIWFLSTSALSAGCGVCTGCMCGGGDFFRFGRWLYSVPRVLGEEGDGSRLKYLYRVLAEK